LPVTAAAPADREEVPVPASAEIEGSGTEAVTSLEAAEVSKRRPVTVLLEAAAVCSVVVVSANAGVAGGGPPTMNEFAAELAGALATPLGILESVKSPPLTCVGAAAKVVVPEKPKPGMKEGT
jgi:hypothetical protein